MYKEKLKSIRDEKEITQEIIAKHLGIHKGLYSQYETEYSIIPLKHLITICDYFKVSMDYILNFSQTNNYNKLNMEMNKTKTGTRLKEFRKSQKLTQEKLAEILNTTHSVIADYERGRYLIATPFLYTICKNYHISADYMLGFKD